MLLPTPHALLAHQGAYFIGKAVWGKGYRELVDLLAQHLEATHEDVRGGSGRGKGVGSPLWGEGCVTWTRVLHRLGAPAGRQRMQQGWKADYAG